MIRRLGLALAFVIATGVAATARADIPPPDSCDTAGERCDNAGDTYDQPGTCTMDTCFRGPPGERMEYECLLCKASTEPGSGGEGSTPGPRPGKDDDDDGGCTISGVGAERGAAGLMLLAGLALLFRGRRR
jgi:MYXO-CTERM domain-containing protein